MSEREKEILGTIAEALPKMDDLKKGEFLGYSKAMVDLKKKNEESNNDDDN